MANPIFKLDGNVVNPVKDWGTIQVMATWDENGGQANISMEDFLFVNENAKTIIDYINNGLVGGLGIFEGMPFSIDMQNGQSINLFEGILDFNDVEVINPVEVKCKLKKLDGLNQLADRSSGITMTYLYEEGVITQSDFSSIPYIKEKPTKDTAVELALLSLSIFLFAKELVDMGDKLAFQLGWNAGAHIAGGISGPVAGGAYVGITIAANIIYFGLIAFQLTKMIIDFIEILIPPIRRWKGAKILTLLEKGLDYIGYQYETSIPEMQNLYILPSKNDEGKVFDLGNNSSVGYPDAIDYGYTLNELITLVNNTFAAGIKIIGNKVYQEPFINDNFWVGQSNYVLPDVENEKILYNTSELDGRKLIRYETDLADYWTILRYKGTGYEIITNPITINDSKAVLIKGLNETIIPYALGDKKLGLNPVEIAIKGLAIAVDAVLKLFKQPANNEAKINSRLDMLHVTGDNLTIGKMLYLTLDTTTDRLLMYNDRYKIEAQTLYNNYHVTNSFVKNNYRGQKVFFKELKIPFGFADFISLIGNSYCTDINGNVIKITELKWSFDGDFAIVSGWQRKPYTKNLKETTYYGLENQT